VEKVTEDNALLLDFFIQEETPHHSKIPLR